METKEKIVLNAKQKFQICKILEDGRERFNGMTKAAITREVQALIDFEVNVSNVCYLCKQMGIESSHQPRPATKAAENNGVLLDIVCLIENVVSAVEKNDLFGADLDNTRDQINRLKKSLS